MKTPGTNSDSNAAILEHLRQFLDANPSQRFGQALVNLGIVKPFEDCFYTSNEQVLQVLHVSQNFKPQDAGPAVTGLGEVVWADPDSGFGVIKSREGAYYGFDFDPKDQRFTPGVGVLFQVLRSQARVATDVRPLVIKQIKEL
jgi:hypothetical protein